MGRSDKNGSIPDGWRIARLGDVATLRPSQQDSDTDNDLPYVGLKHIANGGTLIGTDAAGDYISLKTRFEAGDILFGKLRPNLRKVVRAPFNGMSSTEILAIVARSPADKNFLSYVLRSDPMHNHTMQGITGTKMPRTSWSHMKNYGFLLPPLREQRAIAAVLDSIDGAIERTEAIIATTEQLRDSLLHELLTHGVPGWHTEWKEAPGVGTIPADWNVVRLGDVAEIVMGQSPPGATVFDWNGDSTVSRGLPFIQGNAEFGTNSPKPLKWCAQPAKVARVDDILISVRAPVGETNRANTKIGIGRGLAAIRFAVADARAFGWHALNHAKNALEAVTQGSTFKAIGGQDLRSLPILLPPPPEQQTIATLLDSVDDATDRARRERDGLQTMKGSAADALLTGRMRVSSRTDKH